MIRSVCLALLFLGPALLACSADDIRTPLAPATPRINGATIFGVRPGSPFLYTIPVTGERPINYAVDNLPSSLELDATNGRITGSLGSAGEHVVTLHATNKLGTGGKNPHRRRREDRAAPSPRLE